MYTDCMDNINSSNNNNKHYNKRKFSIKYIIIAVVAILLIIVAVFFTLDFSKGLDFKLLGNNEITINLNGKYEEPGYIANDAIDGDITNKVKVINNIDLTKSGTYEIKYTIKTSMGVSKVLIRTVTVVDISLIIDLSISDTNLTNQDIIININITGDSFKYLVLPDKKIINSAESTFIIKENGDYVFAAYNNKGQVFTKKITISNIDKVKPTGSCVATINQTDTVINVESIDDSKIKNYIYYDNNKELANTTFNTIAHNGKTSHSVFVKVYDNAGNFADLNCQIIDKSYYNPITPPSSENVTFKGETDTIKVYVSKYSGYYLTRIWVKDPYNQLNKFDSPEYGSKLYKPSELLTKATNANNLSNKLLLGFNASGFYLKDTYDASSVSKYSAYNKTSVGTMVITNGKVIRNVYDKAYKTWFITGVDKNNKLRIFTDKKASTSEEIAAKKIWSQEVINSGIRNTFTFAAPLIENGVKTGITTSMPDTTNNNYKGIQSICQINDNNFVLITSTSVKRNTVINKFLDLKCQTATNLDGGGSVALIYKEKNSTSIKTVVGNGRSLPEVGYFSE